MTFLFTDLLYLLSSQHRVLIDRTFFLCGLEVIYFLLVAFESRQYDDPWFLLLLDHNHDHAGIIE